jgi:hypothetical protein
LYADDLSQHPERVPMTPMLTAQIDVETMLGFFGLALLIERGWLTDPVAA